MVRPPVLSGHVAPKAQDPHAAAQSLLAQLPPSTEQPALPLVGGRSLCSHSWRRSSGSASRGSRQSPHCEHTQYRSSWSCPHSVVFGSSRRSCCSSFSHWKSPSTSTEDSQSSYSMVHRRNFRHEPRCSHSSSSHWPKVIREPAVPVVSDAS